MQYEEDYKKTKSLDEFRKRLRRKGNKNKDSSIERTYYKIKSRLGEQGNFFFSDDEKIKPDYFKIMTFNDMIRYGTTINKSVLRRYGFNEAEIRWLEANGHIGENTKFIKGEDY